MTSGCPSPSLGGNVAIGYVESRVAKIGTKLRLQVRNTSTDAEVSKMPFIKTNYFNTGKK